MKRILIQGGRVIDPTQGIDKPLDVLLSGNTIEAVAPSAELADITVDERIDASGKLVVPGLVDIHVHLREPGQEWKETILTGSEAAVAGGFALVCAMPNTKPVNDSRAVTEFMLEQARAANLCKVLPIGAITMGSKGEALAPFLELKEAGCVAFSDDGRPVSHSGIMRRALEYSKLTGAVLTVHEEDLELSDGFSMNESALSIRMGLKGMPDAAENVMIARDIELSRLTGARVHFCHVSTARGVTLVRRAKADGIPVTAEVTPHNLVLDEHAVEGYNTHAKMSMPLRGRADIDALIEGLNDGTIDCIASDHAPHEADSKAVEFERATFGILGLQTSVPFIFSLVREKKISLMRMIDALGPAGLRCFGLPLFSVKAGAEATITILDPEQKFVFDESVNKSKSKNSPCMGAEMQGRATHTIVEGRVVYRLNGSGE